MDESAQSLAAVLGRISHMKSMALIHEIALAPPTVDDILTSAKRATLGDERTIFIVGNRKGLRPLLTTPRTVVLTARELERVQKKFGPLFVLDHAQRRGHVIWDASWVGGALRLKRSGQDWKLETVSEWIT